MRRAILAAGALLAARLILGAPADGTAAETAEAVEPVAPPADVAPPAPAPGEMRFVRGGETVRTISIAALRAACGERIVAIDDPYYGARRSYRACPLAAVVRAGFGVAPETLAREDVVFRASDGYAKPAAGSRLAEEGGFVAFSDADLDGGGAPAFAPIDRKQVDPAPSYLVWAEPAQRDTHLYPWPYALVEIEVTSLAARYPHTVPAGATAGSPARAGYDVFKSECIACHAINGEGGKVGPELNVPRSIVEYRPIDQIKAYIRDPQSFRYTSMPAHPHLSDRQLDDLIAYFEAMRRQKRDPGPSA